MIPTEPQHYPEKLIMREQFIGSGVCTWSRGWWRPQLGLVALLDAFSWSEWTVAAGDWVGELFITAHALLLELWQAHVVLLPTVGPYRQGSGTVFLRTGLCGTFKLLFHHFCSYVVHQPSGRSWDVGCCGRQSVLQLSLPPWVWCTVAVYRSVGFGWLKLLCSRSIGFPTVLTWWCVAFTNAQLCKPVPWKRSPLWVIRCTAVFRAGGEGRSPFKGSFHVLRHYTWFSSGFLLRNPVCRHWYWWQGGCCGWSLLLNG